jgi:hypothetical protein
MMAFHLKSRCRIARIPAGTDEHARQDVLTNLRCTKAFPATEGQYERAKSRETTLERGAGNTPQLFASYIQTPEGATEITDGMRLITAAGRDYRIRVAGPWPDEEPLLYELLVEKE